MKMKKRTLYAERVAGLKCNLCAQRIGSHLRLRWREGTLFAHPSKSFAKRFDLTVSRSSCSRRDRFACLSPAFTPTRVPQRTVVPRMRVVALANPTGEPEENANP